MYFAHGSEVRDLLALKPKNIKFDRHYKRGPLELKGEEHAWLA